MAKPYSDIQYREGKLFWTTGSRKGLEAGTLRNDGYILIEYQGKKWLAHRLIWKTFYGWVPEMLDHINGDRSDNRIENLRPCSKAENAMNYPKKSGYKGVSKHQGKYRATLTVNGKTLNLKSGCTELEAAMIYNIEAEKIFGKFAYLNKAFENMEVLDE